jgi:hypothetical protein
LIDGFHCLTATCCTGKIYRRNEGNNIIILDNSFAIDFVALDYTSQRDGKYAYMLEGFDSDWQYCGLIIIMPNTQISIVGNIPSSYGSNKDGVWMKKGASLR